MIEAAHKKIISANTDMILNRKEKQRTVERKNSQ